MVSESIEFVVDFFENQFQCVPTGDRRLEAFRKYCKTLKKSRIQRTGKGSVIVSVQSYDHLKYTQPCLGSFLSKVQEGVIPLFNEKNESTGNIIIISIGDVDERPHGWKGSISDFLELVQEHKVDRTIDRSDMNRFYLKDFPKQILDSDKTQFYIFGVINTNDDEGYDTAFVSIVGLPLERIEEAQVAASRKMFGF